MNLAFEIENPQACNKCGDKFGTKSELKGHISSVHEGIKHNINKKQRKKRLDES